MIERNLTVVNKLGLHARAAAKMVSIASRYRCTIRVEHGQRWINAKSIMGLLMLGAARGAVLRIRVHGEEEQLAMTELVALFKRRFDEAE